MRKTLSSLVQLGAVTALLTACGGGTYKPPSARAGARIPGDHRAAGRGALSVSWMRDLASQSGGRYVPVERASVAVDERRAQVYAASSFGVLWTFAPDGRVIRKHDLGAAIESSPAVDAETGHLFVATVDGAIRSFNADGIERWSAKAGGPVSAPVALSDDAVYLVTDDDSIVAIARKSGEVLWRYQHESTSELSVAGHAGLLVANGRIYTGLTDGLVVCLDAGDGREIWHVDTALDVPRSDRVGGLVDVDTTPVETDGKVYIASFAAGLYVLDAQRGTVLARRDSYRSVVGLQAVPQGLLLASADKGLLCLDLASMALRWKRHEKNFRGTPTRPYVRGGRVFMGESRGALLVFDLADGSELSRVESAYGFAAAPVFAQRFGFAVSNTARVVAFRY